MTVRPMLGDNKPWNEAIVQKHLDADGYLWMQPKIDGMRTLVGPSCEPLSRSGKVHKHAALKAFLMATPSLRSFDGEVVTGHEYSEDTFRQSMSGIRAEFGDKAFTLYLFDYYGSAHDYTSRLAAVREVVGNLGEFHESGAYHARLVACPTVRVTTLDEIYAQEEIYLTDKWEGGMLRRNGRAYKFGRATANEGGLLKLKRYVTAEAIIVGYERWELNANNPTQSPLGYQVRSSHNDGKIPIDRLGAWHVELATDRSVKFKIGVFRGVSHDDRDRLWVDREAYIGRYYTFAHQGYGGGYDKPRQPVGLNFRPASEF